MKYWRFMDYYTEKGDNLIRDWYESQDEEVRAEFDIVLSRLAGFKDWSDLKEFKILTRKHAGLCQIMFKTRNRNFRPVGFFSPNSNDEFVIVLGCEKSGRVSIPPRAFDNALKFKKKFEKGKGSIHESFTSHIETDEG